MPRTTTATVTSLLDAIELSKPVTRFYYQSIASHVRACIDATPDSYHRKLPSFGAMADFYDVAITTIRHAMRALSDDGIVKVVPGRGTYVIVGENIPAPNDPRSVTTS
jgi:DNA-binding GntR family transcriptional regulator